MLEGLLCMIKVSVGPAPPFFFGSLVWSPIQFAQSPADAAIYGTLQKDHMFIGDVHSVSGQLNIIPHGRDWCAL